MLTKIVFLKNNPEELTNILQSVTPTCKTNFITFQRLLSLNKYKASSQNIISYINFRNTYSYWKKGPKQRGKNSPFS